MGKLYKSAREVGQRSERESVLKCIKDVREV